MAAVETNKQVYMFYQVPYQSNADYLKALKAHIKLSEAHNVVVGYHWVLAATALKEKHNITSNTLNKYKKIDVNIKSR